MNEEWYRNCSLFKKNFKQKTVISKCWQLFEFEFQANAKVTASVQPIRLATTSSAETLASTLADKALSAKLEITVSGFSNYNTLRFK